MSEQRLSDIRPYMENGELHVEKTYIGAFGMMQKVTEIYDVVVTDRIREIFKAESECQNDEKEYVR